MLDFDVDVVLTYVDMRDPVWKKNFDQTRERLQAEGELPGYSNSFDSDRYEAGGLLDLTLFSVREFMSWARKVFLVVSNPEQVPEYAKEYGVEVVLHEQIIPKKYLPTFNSCAIELFLHCIPGLADRFVYVNDDSPILKTTSKATFFDVDGLPVNNYHFKQLKRDRSRLGVLYPIYKNSFRIAMRAAGAKFYRNRKTALVPCHHPKPMLRSACLGLWKKATAELRDSITPFRSEKSVSNYAFCNYMLLTGQTHDREILNSLKLDAESLFGADFASVNDSASVDVDGAKKLLKADCPESVRTMFCHALSISCNNRRRLLQNAAFMYAGIPQPMTFRAVTPAHPQDPDSYGPLLLEMQKEYGFDVRTLWSGVGVKAVKKCCTLSHMLAAYFAKANGWPYALVFEDDAWPMLGAAETYNAVLEAGGAGAGFVKCGFNGRLDGPEADVKVVPYRNTAGSHAYVIFQKFYDGFIKRALAEFAPADYVVTDEVQDAFTLNRPAFIQFNSSLYSDQAVNISSKTSGQAVYIDNHVYGGECPAGYARFEDVLKYMGEIDATLAKRAKES